MSVFMIVRQINDNAPRVENEYWRAVKPEGNLQAQKLMRDVFEPCSKEWRGLPVIPDASLRLGDEFSDYDAEKKFDIPHTDDNACGNGLSAVRKTYLRACQLPLIASFLANSARLITRSGLAWYQVKEHAISHIDTGTWCYNSNLENTGQ